MTLLDQIAERCIAEAEARGELRGLAGEGRPLQLEDLSAVPEELRSAYLLLKNAGFTPPGLHTRRLIREAEDLLQACVDSDVRQHRRLSARLAVLHCRLEQERGRRIGAHVHMEYGNALERRFGN